MTPQPIPLYTGVAGDFAAQAIMWRHEAAKLPCGEERRQLALWSRNDFHNARKCFSHES